MIRAMEKTNILLHRDFLGAHRYNTVEVLEHNKKDLERLLHNEKSAREKQEQQQTQRRNRNGQGL